MAYETLKAAVAAVISANGNEEITGQILKDLINNNIIPHLGANLYKGIAAISTNPGSPEKEEYYVTSKKGVYPNFSGLEVFEELVILIYKGGNWQKETLLNYDDIKIIIDEKVNNAFGGKEVLNGFNGTESNYTKGSTRIQGTPIEATIKSETLKIYGTAGSCKVLEVTKNADGTFNKKQEIFSGTIVNGLNNFSLNNKIINRNSYLAFYSGNSGAEISFIAGTKGWALAGAELVGEDVAVTDSLLDLNFSVSGKSQGVDTLLEFTEETFFDIIEESNNRIFGYKTVSNGFNGVETTYTKGNTRIQGTPLKDNTKIENLKTFGTAGFFKILEVTRNENGKFNFKQLVYDGYMSAGLNTYYIKNKTVSKNSYLAFYSSTASNAAQISFSANGLGWTLAGAELTDSDVAVTDSGINLNFSITGISQGIDTIESQITDIYESKLFNYGNNLISETRASDLNTMQLISNQGKGVFQSGWIKKINLLCVTAGSITFVAYKKLDSGNFEFKNLLGVFPIIVGENNLETNIFIEKDTYIGFFSSNAKLDWSSNGYGWKLAGYPNGENIAMPVTSAQYALNLDIKITGIKELTNKLTLLENNKLDGKIFEIKELIPSTFVNSGWSGVSSPSVVNSHLYYNKNTSMDKWIARVEVNLNDANVNLNMVQIGGIYVSFEFSTSRVFIHSNWNGVVTTTPTALEVGNIDIALTVGKTYILEVEYDTVKTLTARVINKVTTEKFELTHITTGDANQHGAGTTSVGLLYKGGSFTRGKFTQFTTQKTTPKLMIFGNSFVVGYNLIRYGFDSDLRYPQLIKNALNGDVSISAKGGEDTHGMLLKLETDFKIIKPKYTLLAIGLNDDLSSSSNFDVFGQNMSKMINVIKENGSIPILCTYPRLKGDGIASSYNSWIRNYTGELYVDFHLASSSSGTVGAPPNQDLFLADGHPNIEGNQRYFDKFKTDFPYLFKS